MTKRTEEQKAATALKRKETLALQEAQSKVQREKERMEMRLAELKSRPYPILPYKYKVGQEVQARTARWGKMVIREIVDNKYFRCDVVHTEHNYGKPYEYNEENWLTHLDILPLAQEFGPVLSYRDGMTISFHNGELYGLLLNHYQAGIDYSPVYQRELVWTKEDKIKLIDSIFNNIEIGKFAFINRPIKGANDPYYELLDGKQRMHTLIEFYEDKFRYKGLTFSELSFKDKNHFQRYSVACGYAREEMTLEHKLNYFLKMNVSGVAQSEEHLAKVRKLLAKERKKA